MQNDLIKQWAQLSKKANESLKKINSLNSQSIKKLTKLQMDMVSSCLEGGIKKAKNVGTVKSMSDLMNLQSDIYKELSEKVLASAQNSVKVAMETKQAMSDLVKEGLADAPKMVVRPTVKTAAGKPAAKKVAPKKAVAKPAAKKVAPKKAVAKPAEKLQMPKPSGRPMTEGDAKK